MRDLKRLVVLVYAPMLLSNGCEPKQTESPKEKSTVTIMLTSDQHWKDQEGDVLIRADEQGRLINVLSHYLNPEDLIPDLAEKESNKGKPCAVHVMLDDEATMSIKSLEKAIGLIRGAADPRRQTTIYVHLRGLSP